MSLLVLALFSGCALTEHRAAKRLHRDEQDIKRVLAQFPTLADSTITRTHDTIRVAAVTGNVFVPLAVDTLTYDASLEKYVQRAVAIDVYKRNQVVTPTAQAAITRLQVQNHNLIHTLRLGAYRADTTYLYRDSSVVITSKLANGELRTQYQINPRKYAYVKTATRINLHDCITPPYWKYWQFWVAALGWVLIIAGVVIGIVIKVGRPI